MLPEQGITLSFQISPSTRVRPSPFFDSTVEDGVVSFTPYNHMLMPSSYGDPVSEYWRLINGVSMWDVAIERQVELIGPDAGRLAQILIPRKLDPLPCGRGWYVALCDHRGVLINDPILLKLSENRFWLSIADSDILLWARAVAAERGLDVQVLEPDVSPLAVQGPLAEEVVASVFGDRIRALRRFEFVESSIDGIPLMVARTGWSKQGGFELYLMDSRRANDLWALVREAGQPFDIGPGCPSWIERVESGLLSFGGDTDDDTNPFEVRMERFVDLDVPDEVIGIDALRRIHARGPARHLLGVYIDCPVKLAPRDRYGQILRGGRNLGRLTVQVWSPRLERNIGLCLVSCKAVPDDPVEIRLPRGDVVPGRLAELPFL